MAILSEEQTMLRDMAREWTSNESPVTAYRKVRDSGTPAGFDPDAFKAMAEMGWAGIVIPEAHGGSDFGWLSLGLVIEELGKTVTSSPLAASAAVRGGVTFWRTASVIRARIWSAVGAAADQPAGARGFSISSD